MRGAATPRFRHTVVLVAALALTLTACGDDPNSVAEQAKQGGQQGYVAGDGAIEQLAPAQRGEPVNLTGELLDGTPWSSDEVRGKVLVINVWGSWCPPCVEEVDDLNASYEEYADGGDVQFLGINYRESAETGAAFARSRKIPYPSLSDQNGKTLLALQGKVIATPTTLVLDREGRIAARVSGPVTTTTLGDLIDDVVGASGSTTS